MTADEKVQTIKEQLRVILAGVSGIGVIHSYNRWAINWSDILDKFKDADEKINTIQFAREKVVKRVVGVGANSPRERAHIFLFRCVMGLNDSQATGETFDTLLSNIEEAFDDLTIDPDPANMKYTLHGTCMTTTPGWGPMEGKSGMQIELVDERMFGKTILCHYAELRLCAIERH